MSKWDKIFRERLDGIREELNSYLSRYNKTLIDRSAIEDGFVSAKKRKLQMAEDLGAPIQPSVNRPEGSRASIQPPASLSLGSACKVPQSDIRIPEFLQKTSERPELDRVLAKKEESFSELLLRIIDEKGLKDSDVYKNANIDRRLFSKIRGDEDYVPSKKTAIAFCLALQLDIDEAKKLLATAGYTLSASSRFDLIIMYLIENCEYNIHFANIVLYDYGEGTLSR